MWFGEKQEGIPSISVLRRKKELPDYFFVSRTPFFSKPPSSPYMV
jgi:hypothetical protein